jgi:uncharacterized protein
LTKAAMPPGEVVFPGSRLHHVESRHTGREYDLYVNLPDVKDGSRYPVIYILDAQWGFKDMVSAWAALRNDRQVPDCIIVGVAYSGESPEYSKLRMMDLTPTAVDSEPGSGGAERLLNFLESEAIPFIEAEYPTDPSKRILNGNSLGGLFALYAAMERPSLFHSYIAGTAAFSWDDHTILRHHDRLSEATSSWPTHLHLFVGESEPLRMTEFQRMVWSIAERNYEDLRFTHHVVPGARHNTSHIGGIVEGLREAFRVETIILAQDVLQTYVGTYTSESGAVATVELRQGKLTFRDRWTPIPDTLRSLSAVHFAGTMEPIELTFQSVSDVIRSFTLIEPGDTRSEFSRVAASDGQ